MKKAEAVATERPPEPPRARNGPRPPDASRTAASGDAASEVTDLYRGHALGLTRLALVMVGDRGTAEDIVQDAFAGLYRRWPRLHDRDKALTYVRSAVLNRSRTVLRRRRMPLRVVHQPPVWSAEAEALVAEDRREVMEALHRLPVRQREALVLRYFCDLSEGEIAAAMRVSRGTVKSTTSRAVAALGRMLEEKP
ncbi:RNA polymerase sigma-70 factor (sigma-E family) [Actinomadura pelletieri DSM 43383]|uniref:RNA polymerase sigma-70 factor (Sigma-E family) n=1 Tax=Actinomadura pelletieri DSM 43383 TaxID=1120940 RepID=A0A495QFW5_9ACTN|nr:SigE family RNA polymerase sigma factor [Actinomadura pelletieri]RKS70708.1 RNA polymerase sigma-70 factor (sigma-E family) [Actinomadura pelletieri DSM 43383]